MMTNKPPDVKIRPSEDWFQCESCGTWKVYLKSTAERKNFYNKYLCKKCSAKKNYERTGLHQANELDYTKRTRTEK